jgi:hypothetical protein
LPIADADGDEAAWPGEVAQPSQEETAA